MPTVAWFGNEFKAKKTNNAFGIAQFIIMHYWLLERTSINQIENIYFGTPSTWEKSSEFESFLSLAVEEEAVVITADKGSDIEDDTERVMIEVTGEEKAKASHKN
jgi:hypothetical protein